MKNIEELKKWLKDNDYKDTLYFDNPNYISAIIGITESEELVYDYDKMVDFLMASDEYDFDDETEAYEFIDYNLSRMLNTYNGILPVIMYKIIK